MEIIASFVVHDALNHSDHLPVVMILFPPCFSDIYKYFETGFVTIETLDDNESSLKCELPPLRWDKSDTSRYYYMTGELLYSIYDRIQILNKSKTMWSNSDIEDLYIN